MCVNVGFFPRLTSVGNFRRVPMGELVRSSSSHTGPGEPATPGRGGRHVGGARWGSEDPSSQCAPPYLPCPGVLEGEGDCCFLWGLPTQGTLPSVYPGGCSAGASSKGPPIGSRTLLGQYGEVPVGQPLPTLGGRPGSLHHAPLWLTTQGPHLSSQLRVFSPNQGSSLEPTNIFICLPRS